MAGQHQSPMMCWKQSCCSATGTPLMPSAMQGICRVYAEAQRKRCLAAAGINVGSRAVAHSLLKVYMARRAINGLQEPSYSNMQVSSKSVLLSGLIT